VTVVTAAVAGFCVFAGAGSSRGLTDGAESVTLVYWDDIYIDESGKKANQEMIRLFEKANPGVKVKWVAKPFAQFVPTARLALSGAGAPDLVICAAADTCNADLVKARLVIPTDTYAKKYGWFKGIDPVLLGTLRHEKDGTTYRGQTYGMSLSYDVLGVYYNKAKLKELGLKVPRTQAEFEQALAKAKAAGETPIMLGDLDRYPLSFLWMMLVNYEMPYQQVRNWQYKKAGSNIDTAGAVRAVKTLKRWYDAGYFNADVLGITQPTAMERFDQGEGVFSLTGAWWTSMLDTLGDDAGFFLYPPKKLADKPVATHTLGNNVMITSKSKNPDIAAKFLAFISGPKTAQIRASQGINTTHLEGVKSVPTATGREILSEFRRMQKTGIAMPFLDATPRMMVEVLDAGLQNVFGGKKAPEKLIEEAQEEQAKVVSERVRAGWR
jgi:raffinose/stachyose/melibiose transport system substrate-binding protein